MSRLGAIFQKLNEEYTQLHTAKEDHFWKSKMGIATDPVEAKDNLVEADLAVRRFLQNPKQLRSLRALSSEPASDEEKKVLNGWIDVFAAHVIEDPEAQTLSEEILTLESSLEQKRLGMKLGFIDPDTGVFEEASSIKLSLMLRTEPNEARRKAAFEGMRTIENFVLENGFLEIVKKRNRLGRMLGYEDYYDWRVSVVEKMRKKEIFSRLDDLAERTMKSAKRSLADFAEKNGKEALEPWNFLYMRSGELTKELEPYFSFASSFERWGRSFAALNITYRGARLVLDLLNRKGKYENGFMHGPELAFVDQGTWKPARIHFTANAVPGQVGSGRNALRTLFHEGGHAAHFSNITQPSPCFSHEFAPTSVSYAETQSMFLDSFLEDADWMIRYAKDVEGNTIPVSLIERNIRESQPFKGWSVRAMLTVPMAERAMYELDEKDCTPEKVLKTFRKIESEMQGLTSGVRPVLAVPHLLSGEASAYYHGYILAEMAVYQTRAFFLKRDGFLTDNPKIGPELAEGYWKPGNSESFLDVVKSLTGKVFSADALVDACNKRAEDACAEALEKIEKSKARACFEGKVELDASIQVVHGHEEITSTENVSFDKASSEFSSWIAKLA